jgi:stage II sporulation protein D
MNNEAGRHYAFRREPKVSVRRWLTRLALLAGLGVILLSGCSCEKPRPRPMPAPSVGVKDQPIVRARLGDETPTVWVAVMAPWRVIGPAGQLAAGEKMEWTEVACNSGGIVFAGQPPMRGGIELYAETDGAIWVRQTVGGKERERYYRGYLRFLPTTTGTLRVINILPMEHYLAGVVGGEMPPGWNIEALKAQAVAARSYALAERNTRVKTDFDVYDSTLSQVYGGCGIEAESVWRALAATQGVVASYNAGWGKSEVLTAWFHSTCGGATVLSGGVFGGTTPPPLAGVVCHYCRNSPKYHWAEVVLTKREIGEALKKTGYTALVRLKAIARVEVASTFGEGGRAATIRVVDEAGASVIVDSNYWRGILGPGRILSTWFDIEDRGSSIALVNGRGWGHGVGLCQYGAGYLADHGKTGEEILRYYYSKVDLVRAY